MHLWCILSEIIACCPGGVDVLINTVGIVDCFGDVEELPVADWDRVMAVNLTSAYVPPPHTHTHTHTPFPAPHTHYTHTHTIIAEGYSITQCGGTTLKNGVCGCGCGWGGVGWGQDVDGEVLCTAAPGAGRR